MYNDINQEMEELQQQIFRRNKLKNMLAELRNQRRTASDKTDELKHSLDQENEDVEKLESKNLTHLFYSVLGKLGEQVEKEKQEALAAKLKYDQAIREIEQIDQQIHQCEKESAEYFNCQRQYDALYEKKKQLLMEANSETAQQLLDIAHQLDAVKNNQKEIKEAIHAGNEVSSHIERALESLDKAEGWGTYDLLGGGLIADLAKHSHIDDAKGEADQIQWKLSQFRTELADVKIYNDIHFETDGFGKFADFFFDGLIADWCMQSRINESADSIRRVQEQVRTVLFKLKTMEDAEAKHILELEGKRNRLITGA